MNHERTIAYLGYAVVSYGKTEDVVGQFGRYDAVVNCGYYELVENRDGTFSIEDYCGLVKENGDEEEVREKWRKLKLDLENPERVGWVGNYSIAKARALAQAREWHEEDSGVRA